MRAADDFDAIRRALETLKGKRADVDFLIMPSRTRGGAFAWRMVSERAKQWVKKALPEGLLRGDNWYPHFAPWRTPKELAANKSIINIAVASEIADWTYRLPHEDEMPE